MIPLAETNFNRATLGESLLNPASPSHSSPPPVVLLFSKKHMIIVSDIDSTPLT